MDLTALLSRIQFAFTISFHIIFPSFTIGLAAWLTNWVQGGMGARSAPIGTLLMRHFREF
jgi:Cytochrome bd terminal oxidase subunit I